MSINKILILLLSLAVTNPGLAKEASVPAEAKSGLNFHVRFLDYIEQPYTLQEGEYDHRPLEGLKEPSIEENIEPGLDRFLPMGPPRTDPALPDPVFDVSSGTSLSQGPAPTIAAGPNHVVAVSSQGISGFTKAGGLVMSSNLPGFFASATATEPRVIWDSTYSRYVVIALDVDSQAPDADLLAAVSDDSDPAGTWFILKIPAYLPVFDPDGPGPRPAGPHLPSNPMIGMESNQIYVSLEMRTPNSSVFDGTAVWNVWKWTTVSPSPGGGFYSGSGTATIQAGLRPFSVGNDYGNEVPLTPVNIVGPSPAGNFANRGIFLAGYGGKTVSGAPMLQVFWVSVVGPTVNKMLVPLGIADNLSIGTLPGAPQPGTAVLVPTGKRSVQSAMWELGKLWMTTMVVPGSGPDAGEATASWVQINAVGTSGLTLGVSGTISGDELVDDTYTFNASIVRSNSETVGLSFSVAALELPLSSMVSFIGPFCEEPNVQLAPDFLRVGSSPWEGSLWGPVSGTGADGNCVWSHNAHATQGGGGSWTSSVGKFCRESGLVFKDGFETGHSNGWCLTLP